MFKPAEKSELSQVSLTGIRAIAMLGLLTQAPRTLSEIKEIFVSLNIMEKDHSDDILRIDLNTLRIMGCEITKATKKTDYKYVLVQSPFTMEITPEEIDVLTRIYKKIKSKNDIKVLIKYHELFKEIASHIENEETIEYLYGISVLRSYDIDLLKDLYQDCKFNRTLKILYETSGTSKPSEKEVYAQELVFKNDKIYLYGYDLGKKRSVTYNFQRIRSVLARFISRDNVDVKRTDIKFFLQSFGVLELEDNENIVETCDNGYIIEGSYYNDFVAIQRVLSFGANCTVLEPSDFKIKIIEKLRSMKGVYDND